MFSARLDLRHIKSIRLSLLVKPMLSDTPVIHHIECSLSMHNNTSSTSFALRGSEHSHNHGRRIASPLSSRPPWINSFRLEKSMSPQSWIVRREKPMYHCMLSVLLSGCPDCHFTNTARKMNNTQQQETTQQATSPRNRRSASHPTFSKRHIQQSHTLRSIAFPREAHL